MAVCKFIFILAFFILNAENLLSKNIGWLEENSWNTFEGYLGTDEIQLSVYLFEDGKLKGNYVLSDNTSKITFSGYSRLNEILLREDSAQRQLSLEVSTDNTNSLSGIWFDEIHDRDKSIRLKLTYVSKSTFEQRYPGLFGTTDEIEAFMLKIKQAIIANDRQWMADHLQFPVRGIGKEQFLKNMNGVIDSGLRRKIKKVYTTNLFTRNGLVMMADGEVWVGNSPGSTPEKYDFIIVTI